MSIRCPFSAMLMLILLPGFPLTVPCRKHSGSGAPVKSMPIEYLIPMPQARLLRCGLALPVEFVDRSATSVMFPDAVELLVEETVPPVHGQHDSTWMSARLANKLEVNVPHFIKTGDLTRIDTTALEYKDRARY